MATLQKLRNMGPLLIIIVGLALFAFIAGDAWKILQPHQGTLNVGSVNGKSISVTEYQKLFDEYTNVMKILRNTNNLTEEDYAQAKDYVWYNLVRSQIINDEAEKIGITFTDAELQNIVSEGTHPILQQTPFYNPQERKFDVDALNQFLSDYDQNKHDENFTMQYKALYDYWRFIEKTIENEIIAQKYQVLVMNSIISNPVVAKSNYESNNATYDVEIKAIPYNTIADSTINVSNSEIKKLYNEKKDLYKQLTESRNIKYVSSKVTPSAQDREALRVELAEIADSLKAANGDYESLSRFSYSEVPYSKIAWAKDIYPEEVQVRLENAKENEVFGPIYNASDDSYTVFKYLSSSTVADSVKVKLLYVVRENEEATKALTDSLMAVLKGGANFKELAQKYDQEGEENWIKSSDYEGARLQDNDVVYLSTILNADKNKYGVINFEGIPTKIIFMVTEKKNPEKKYNAVVIKRQSQFSSETYNEAYNKFSQFVASCKSTEDLESKAEEFGYTVLEQNNLFNSAHNVANIAQTRNAIKWLFSEAKVGQVSPLYECGNNDNLLVISPTKVSEQGYVALDEVKSELKFELLNDKKAESIIAQMSGKNFDEIGAMNGAKSDVVKRISFSAPAFINITSSSEPVISAVATRLNEGEVSAPVKGNNAVYVIKLISKSSKDAEFNAETEGNNVRMNIQRSASQFLRDLNENANVVDNRYLFF